MRFKYRRPITSITGPEFGAEGWRIQEKQARPPAPSERRNTRSLPDAD